MKINGNNVSNCSKALQNCHKTLFVVTFLHRIQNQNAQKVASHIFLFKATKSMSGFRIIATVLGCITIVKLYHHAHEESIVVARNPMAKLVFFLLLFSKSQLSTSLAIRLTSSSF